MRIAIFDGKHFEVAHTALRFFAAGDNELFMCVSARLHELFREAMPEEMDRHQWLVHDRPGEEKAYLDRVGRLLDEQSIDLLWISTIDNNYLKAGQVARRTRRARTVMAVHNLNHWLGGPSLSLSVRAWRAFLSRKWLFGGLDGLCVLEEGLAENLKALYGYRKPVFVLPGLVFEDALVISEDDAATRFVAPGGIEAKRRDYHLLLDGFEAAHRADPDTELTLLGGPIGGYGREILARCEEMRGRGMLVHTYDGFVAQDEFHRQMKRAHLVLAPIQVETSFSGTREVYGETKSSGAIGDIVRYAKSAVVPGSLRVAEDLQPALLTYADRDGFVDLVVRLAIDRGFRNERIQAGLVAARHYTPQALYRRMEPGLRALTGARGA